MARWRIGAAAHAAGVDDALALYEAAGAPVLAAPGLRPGVAALQEALAPERHLADPST